MNSSDARGAESFGNVSEDRLTELFDEVPVPPGVEQWRRPLTVPPTRRWRLAAASTAFAVLVIVALVQLWPTHPSVRPVEPPSSEALWPSGTTTGVLDGPPLATHEGDLHITTAGAVISDLLVRGTVFVDAPDVTLRRIRIVPALDTEYGLYQRAANLTVDRCEIGPGLRFGVLQSEPGLSLSRCHLSGLLVGLTLRQGAVVSDTLIDGMVAGPYTAGILTHGVDGGPVVIRHNTILIGSDGGYAIGLMPTYGPSQNITVENNLLAGGGFSLSGGGLSAPLTRGIQIIGNHFSRMIYPKGGSQGPATAFDPDRADAVWRDNVWHETGEPVAVP